MPQVSLAGGVLLCLTLVGAVLPPGRWQLRWSDEFDAPVLNESWWNVGTLRAPRSSKFPNGSIVPGAYGGHLLKWQYLGYIMEDDVLLENGVLRLRNQRRQINGTDPAGIYSFSSGWIQSMHKVYYTYGYVEVKARYPLGNKVWPAFWACEEDLAWGAEFDIAEYFGLPWTRDCVRELNCSVAGPDILTESIPLNDCCTRCASMDNCLVAVWTTSGTMCHYKSHMDGSSYTEPGSVVLHPGPAGLGQNLHSGANNWYDSWNVMCMDPLGNSTVCEVANWHTYGLVWGPNGMDFYIDGLVQKKLGAADIVQYPNRDMYFILNNGVSFYGNTSQTPWPNYAEFDYIRLYKQVGVRGEFLGGDIGFGLDKEESMLGISDRLYV